MMATALLPDGGARGEKRYAIGGGTVEIHTGDLDGLEADGQDLSRVAKLYAGNKALVDLSPLDAVVHLTVLHLHDNCIADLSPLAALVHMRDLDLDGNAIVDVSPLASLVNVRTLKLSHNYITDISALSAMKNMSTLFLRDNCNVDLSPLVSMSHIMDLVLQNNKIVDVSPLAHLVELLVLELGNNEISDISPLASLRHLVKLSLEENLIVDLAPLASMDKMSELYLSFNHIADVSPLAAMVNMTELRLDENDIVDVSPLASMVHMRLLNLANNEILERGHVLALLISMTNLERIALRGNPCASIPAPVAVVVPHALAPEQVAALARIPFPALEGGSARAGGSAPANKRKHDSHQTTCSICLAEFEGGDTVITLPRCVHMFCEACIVEWLGTHGRACPLCRASAVPFGEGASLTLDSDRGKK
jgi:Leucine-rich repeat (LRR) protein